MITTAEGSRRGPLGAHEEIRRYLMEWYEPKSILNILEDMPELDSTLVTITLMQGAWDGRFAFMPPDSWSLA